MSRHTSSKSASGGITLTIVDNASRLQIIEVDLSGFERMANFLTSHETSGGASVGARPELWGRSLETKTVEVDYFQPESFSDNDKAADVACDLAEKQNPGWEAGGYQRKYNGHRISGGKMTVHICRWVEST
jgi:hypothetical protein